MNDPKKVYVKTYGCQMNAYDSGRMAEVMAGVGYRTTETPGDADLVILNTCHIREKAAEKVYSDIGRLKKMKSARGEEGREVMIAVGGCVGQAEGAEIMRRAPVVDMVFGPQTYHRLPDMVARAGEERARLGHARVLDTEFTVEDKFAALPPQQTLGASASFLTIQEGCDKFCTFCVVPYTRGSEFSRRPDVIEAEARKLVAEGVKEITLLGQNVNAYHGEGEEGAVSLARLIRRLAEIKGLERIRYTTSHPRDMDADLIALHGELEQCMPYMHLPVQSGSDRILAAMNRGHSADDYLRIIEALRKARRDIALSSDFIVGFPGETDADFAATMTLIRKVNYAQAYSFKYSARPGTPAADMENQVPEALKSERLAELQAELGRQQQAFNETSVGQRMPILFERTGRSAGQIIGRSPYMQAVHADIGDAATAEALLNRITLADIRAAGPRGLSAHIAQEAVKALRS
jgi:tRNA-2-methylthio-N6-dimethylallyladenosine synthase